MSNFNIYNIECSHCGKVVERNSPREMIRCYSCKKERRTKYAFNYWRNVVKKKKKKQVKPKLSFNQWLIKYGHTNRTKVT